MRIDFQTRWLRVLIEWIPACSEIRRYRVAPAKREIATRRQLRRQIARRFAAPNDGPPS